MASRSRQQSAMEYLMTYGWSILIIAIVLAALYSLGVFGSSNLGPRLPPNSCRVYRPSGSGTITNINLEGTCNGELPQYVGVFNGGAHVAAPSTSTLNSPVISNQISVFAWFYNYNYNEPYPTIVSKNNIDGSYQLGLYQTVSAGQLRACLAGGCYTSPANSISNNQWYFGGFTYVNGNLIFYINGVAGTPQAIGGSLIYGTDQLAIGDSSGYAAPFNGLISNVQIYNTALDANSVLALYDTGIGGAPINLQGLAAWYPLDGDGNDYSGNGNNGALTNVAFTASWKTGYVIP